MADLIAFLKVAHIINAILMAWPFYALVGVNQRARLGPPLGDRADTYMENIIKNRSIPCFVFQATALVTGVALVLLRGQGLGTMITNPMLGLKFLLLLLIAALLAYVHLSLQPRIDALFAQAGNPVPAEIAPRRSRARGSGSETSCGAWPRVPPARDCPRTDRRDPFAAQAQGIYTRRDISRYGVGRLGKQSVDPWLQVKMHIGQECGNKQKQQELQSQHWIRDHCP